MLRAASGVDSCTNIGHSDSAMLRSPNTRMPGNSIGKYIWFDIAIDSRFLAVTIFSHLDGLLVPFIYWEIWYTILINHYPVALAFTYVDSGTYSVRSYRHSQGFHISISWLWVEFNDPIRTIAWSAASFCVFRCRCWSMTGIGMYTGILAVTLWNICEPVISQLWHPSWS